MILLLYSEFHGRWASISPAVIMFVKYSNKIIGQQHQYHIQSQFGGKELDLEV